MFENRVDGEAIDCAFAPTTTSTSVHRRQRSTSLAVGIPADIVTTLIAAAEIIVEGRVQGVGFRAYVDRRASLLGVTGYVMNLNDGRVRVHAEGERHVIDALINELRRGPRGARVEQASVRWIEPTGRFASFGVRYSGEDDAG